MIGRVKRLLLLVLLLCLCVGCGSGGHACSGGREILLRAVPQHGESLTPAGMELARKTIASRLGSLGVSSPSVTIRGGDEIVVSGSVPKNLASVVSATGNLQFFDFEKDLAPPTVSNGEPTPYPTLYSLLWTVRAEAAKGTPEAYYLFGFKQHANDQYPVLQGPDPSRKTLLAPYRGKQPSGTTVLAVPANREVVSGSGSVATAATRPLGRSPDGQHWYLFKLPPEISGSDLNESEISASTDPTVGQPQVTLGFNGHGGKEFQAITKAEYERGKLVAGLHGSAGRLNQLYAQHNAIVLDGKLEEAPYIDYTDSALSLGIGPGAGMVISNIGSMQAAKRLAVVLQSGSLPYRFEQISSKLCRSK